MIVILLGPPGVGKGTQGVLLCEQLGLHHLSTGDLLRAARREGTPLGQEAQKFMDAGQLVPDEVILGMVGEKLTEMGRDAGVVFDGFPRTVPQAEALGALLSGLDRRVDRVIVLTADDRVLVQRVSGRRSCPECGTVYNVHFNPPSEAGKCDKDGAALTHRADDSEETVATRLEVYRRQTEPLVSFYERSDAEVRHVDGDQAVDKVQGLMQEALGQR